MLFYVKFPKKIYVDASKDMSRKTWVRNIIQEEGKANPCMGFKKEVDIFQEH